MAVEFRVLRSLDELDEWFTVTRVVVRVSPKLGSYNLDVEGHPIDAVEAMAESGDLDQIIAISGIAHSPNKTWRVAFRIDDEGPKVAANASPEAVEEIRPRLAGVIDAL